MYVGTLDGRLAALNARTGRLLWQVTTVDQNQPYTITGAPRIVKGKVIHRLDGGGEYGARGYVSAYDAASGKLAWRFYTVPGDPSKPFESPALETAAKTWNGDLVENGRRRHRVGTDLPMILSSIFSMLAPGMVPPWNREVRSPAGGDNLYLSSIIALRPGTGELVWHYQTTPGDTWDFTATQHIILADLVIEGQKRKVLMQAPKNGFFYAIDRQTGKLISAEAYVPVTWAKGIDKTRGPADRRSRCPLQRFIGPCQAWGPLGGHNWQPMSYSPQTGLGLYSCAGSILCLPSGSQISVLAGGPGTQESDFTIFKQAPPPIPVVGHLLAWDPVAQKERWRVQYNSIWNGGTLATAGNLVFQGTADGRFVAYSADRGEKLWEVAVGTRGDCGAGYIPGGGRPVRFSNCRLGRHVSSDGRKRNWRKTGAWQAADLCAE